MGEVVGQWDSKKHSEARDCGEGTDNLGEKTKEGEEAQNDA